MIQPIDKPSNEKRRGYRHCMQVPITLEFDHGLKFPVMTHDISMDGLFVESVLPINKEWEGQCGRFSIPFRQSQKTFHFEVVRVVPEGMGLQITNQLGLFGKIIIDGVFGDVF